MGTDHGGFPPPEELLSVRRDRRGGAIVVSAMGEVDTLTVARLRDEIDAAFAESDGSPIVIDLTEVTFLGSRGLSALVDAHRTASPSVPLRVVVDHNRPVVRPLQITGLSHVLTLYHYVEEALGDNLGDRAQPQSGG